MSNYELGIRIRSDFRQHHTEALKSANHQKALNTVMRNGLQAGRQGAQGLRELETSARSSSNALKQIAGIAGSAWAGLQLIEKAKDASRTAAEIQNVRTRIEGLTSSSSDYANVESYLVELSERHHKSLLDLSDSYARILTLEKAGIVTRRESQAITEGLSNAQSRAGASSEDLKLVLKGLSQGFSQVNLQVTELDQVVDPLPGLLQNLDTAAGLAAGGFRRMVSDGKVTSGFFKQTLIKALGEYEGAAERTAGNISAAHADHENSYLKLVKAYETPISDSTKTILNASSVAMELFAENAENVSTIIQGAVVLGMAHAASATTTYTASKISNIQASRAQQVATLAEVKALELKAISQHNANLQEQAGLKRALLINSSSEVRSALLTKLAVTNGRVIASEQLLTASRVKLAAVTTTATVATRGLALASSFVGGLPGLITIAAIAMLSYASSTDEATEKTKKLAKESDELNPFKNFSLSRAKNTLLIYEQQLISAQQLAKETGEKFKNSFWGVTAGEVDKANEKVIKLQTEIAALQAIVDKSGNSKPNPESKEQVDATKKGQTLLDNMRQQAALHGKTSNEAKVRYELEHGNLVAINEDIKQQLILEAQLLDQKKKRTEQESEFSSVRSSLLSPEQQENETHKSNINTLNTELSGTTDFEKRQRINKLIELEELRHSNALTSIEQKKKADADQIEINARAVEDQRMKDARDAEIALLQGFHSRKESEEQAHKDRLLDISLQGTGDYGTVVKQFNQMDRESGQQRIATSLDIAGKITSIGANQSKKAFELNKGVNIAQAIMSTYTAAAKALELGPIAGPIAAGVVTGMGLLNVQQIESQRFTGQAHNGLRKNSDEGTYVIRRDEMMMNPQQRDNFEVLLSHVNEQKQQYKSTQDNQNISSKTNNVINLNIIEDASKAGSMIQSKSLTGEDVINIFVSDVRNGGDAASVIETTYSMQRTGT
jgi:tape measure domain-containing protein